MRRASDHGGKKNEKERRKESLFVKETEAKRMLLLARQSMNFCAHTNIEILDSGYNSLLK